MRAWLSLGSNLQQPVTQLKEALRRLGSLAEIRILGVSHLYRTPPWGDKRQNDFVNAVAQVETRLEPMPLLRVLQSIENDMGRQRSGRRWGPRLIDIDLLLYGELSCRSQELELPHPRMHERAFVMVPLCELDAAVNIPDHGAAGDLLRTLDCTEIVRLDDEGHDRFLKESRTADR
jgi:2-amino-4-hydroxy-6-hydroxymethyldihydropteridine diphosphokinase